MGTRERDSPFLSAMFCGQHPSCTTPQPAVLSGCGADYVQGEGLQVDAALTRCTCPKSSASSVKPLGGRISRRHHSSALMNTQPVGHALGWGFTR